MIEKVLAEYLALLFILSDQAHAGSDVVAFVEKRTERLQGVPEQ